jgi:uncharacterized protein YprB with RNaseH-like and TPR domain
MPSITEKLKSMGVKVGAQDLAPPRPPSRERVAPTIEQFVPGRFIQTSLGETFLVESTYPASQMQGKVCLQYSAPLDVIAEWAGEKRICDCQPQSFAFIDTETTGLSGGAGTYAFLVGIGRFEGQDFRLAQFFMRDPIEEPAQLAAIESFLAPCQVLVSFNGKAFDIPLLRTRYITHGWPVPFVDTAHVDLLHLARRLWRDRLPSRTLGNLEVQILGAVRTEEDVPGWKIPYLYFDYLRGDVEPLKSVFYHNAMDILSLAALFSHMTGLLADPLNGGIEHGLDILALARLFEGMGNLEMATRLYLRGLEQDIPGPNLLDAIQRLALIHKRQQDLQSAIALWEQAARREHLLAHIELAKIYEHQARDYTQAIYWTQTAIDLACSPGFSRTDRIQCLPELEHRLKRLQRKLEPRSRTGDDIIPTSE